MLTAQLREEILEAHPYEHPFDRVDWERQMYRVYGPVAPGVIELQDRLDSYRVYCQNTLTADWDAVCQCLCEAPTAAQMRKIIEDVGLCYDDFESFYSASVLADAVKWGKDLKDRYTVLWLYHSFFS